MSPIHYLSEDDLISLLKKRDQRAFNYLYDNYSGALYGVVTRIVLHKNYADEVIQDVFVKIWNHVALFNQEKGRLYTWMINIARNTSIDYIKSKSVQNEQKNQSLPDVVNSTETHHYAVMDQVDKIDFIGLNNVLDKLKPDWRRLIEMAYYEGYTQQEIADNLSIPLGTVKTRVRAALLQLRVILNEQQ
ncbi:sigma-70 family RNA polymerase sigma factor [Sphingobacterium oryzagri]|uniref:Sigma-70 family RNA polymerase sigma factor n=1 Tax=Sphingobacterium oryzagri TaxID=3025669 RepID=A0ABY7WNX6_9SPHI|nr:sigma-70 family RNA polymerase sigma factor [Sphingobacterium sp. KACC 22765]WDF70030.1 sigma-70 family RNA polymerase sigma factor [Sphingobacterium sp. KACC 22765]